MANADRLRQTRANSFSYTFHQSQFALVAQKTESGHPSILAAGNRSEFRNAPPKNHP